MSKFDDVRCELAMIVGRTLVTALREYDIVVHEENSCRFSLARRNAILNFSAFTFAALCRMMRV